MNEYWIDTSSGIKARIIYPPSKNSDKAIKWLEYKNSKRQVWADEAFLKKYWMPITKAEYNSDLTLKEIQNERNNSKEQLEESHNNLEVGGTHYQKPIQVWDFVYANKIPFDEASAIKYLCRHKEKNGAEDIKKAISYCKHILKTQYNEVY